MIKAVLADVDGVMIGKREGVNFPLPHKDVVDKLRRMADSGMPVILCTAKFHVAIQDIITRAGLANPHITDGGALIINPLGDKKVISYYEIEKSVVKDYLDGDATLSELYTPDDYYLSRKTDPAFVRKRVKVLQKEPVLVDDLAAVADRLPIIKIISFSKDQDDVPAVEAQVRRLGTRLNHIWTTHPYLMPKRICIMTAPGVSKDAAAQEVLDGLGLSFESTLGLGDSPADWDFMQYCGYAATIGKNEKLHELARQKEHHYIGGAVDDNGLLDVFRHFGL